METKPFSLQSPENIAKDYGGNKQKIAQAMQMGMIDPTAGLLAGMFIDRIRSAQMAEAAPTQTVAQETFTPPQPAPMQIPGGGMPPMPGAPGPEAGLGALPVPDQMFEGAPGGVMPQPDDGQYAEGGTVPDNFKRAIITQENRGKYAGVNKSSGAMGKYQLMPDTARALAKRLGVPYNPTFLTIDTPEARVYQDMLGEEMLKEAWAYGKGDPSLAAGYYFAGPDKGGWKDKTRQYTKDILGRLGEDSEAIAQLPERNMSQQGESLASLSDIYGLVRGTLDVPTPRRDAALAYIDEQLSPEEQKARKKQDMWQALAQLGFGMASSQSPYFLQAVGQAGKEVMPQVAADGKSRRDDKAKMITAGSAIEDKGRQENAQELAVSAELFGEMKKGEHFDAEMASRERIAAANRVSAERIATLDRETKEDIAKAAASGKTSDYEGAVARKYAALLERKEQGVPMVDPLTGLPVPRNVSEAELRQLADTMVRFEMNAMRADEGGAPGDDRARPAAGAKPAAGAGWGKMTVE